jgi:hypothetical protein
MGKEMEKMNEMEEMEEMEEKWRRNGEEMEKKWRSTDVACNVSTAIPTAIPQKIFK